MARYGREADWGLSVQVQAISDLSHEVTGVRMYSFYREEDEKRRKTSGPLGSVRHALTLWQRCGGLGHGARRGYIRWASRCHRHSLAGCCISGCRQLLQV